MSVSDKTGGMSKLSKKVVEETDARLADRELDVLSRSVSDLSRLKPDIADVESFNKLIEAVSAATARNEGVGQLRARIEALGDGVLGVAKKIVALI